MACFDWLWVLLGIVPSRNPNCIYDEQALRDVIQAGGEARLCAVCDDSDIVKLLSEIDVTGKSFSIVCELENDKCSSPSKCMIQSFPNPLQGDGSQPTVHRLISGAPQSAQFDNIQFSSGIANQGGAFYLNGGSSHFNGCQFTYNYAKDGNGGALYISGSSTEVTLTGTGESTYNFANYGAFLFATDGAVVTVDGSGTTDGDISGISLNRARESGGFLAATDGAQVSIRTTTVRCGNQARGNGGDYLFIGEDASVECQDVSFQVLATSERDEVPPSFNSTIGILGESPTCKASAQVGEIQCKRNKPGCLLCPNW